MQKMTTNDYIDHLAKRISNRLESNYDIIQVGRSTGATYATPCFAPAAAAPVPGSPAQQATPPFAQPGYSVPYLEEDTSVQFRYRIEFKAIRGKKKDFVVEFDDAKITVSALEAMLATLDMITNN